MWDERSESETFEERKEEIVLSQIEHRVLSNSVSAPSTA